MPRLLERNPSYRKHKATRQAVVTLSGRDFYLGRWGTPESKAEYQRRVREWNAAGRTLAHETGEGLSISELLAAFWRHAKQYYVDADGRPSQEQINFGTLIRRLRKAYGSTGATEFGPLKLKAFRQLLIDAGLARNNVNRQITRVRHVFTWAVGNEMVPASVAHALKCVSGLRYGKTDARESEPVKPVPEALVDAVLPRVAPQVKAMIELQRVTGMRSGEVCQMRTCDINTQHDTWSYTPARHKTKYRGHERTVFLGPRAQEIVKPWLRTDLQAYIFSPAGADEWRRQQRRAARKTPANYGNHPGSNRKRRPLRKAGECYTAGSYGRAIQYACELAFGMPKELRRAMQDETDEQRAERNRLAAEWRREHCWHPHQLRHNAATLFRREYGLEVARVLLGHKTTDITELYAEADHQRAVEVMAKIG